MLLLMPLAPYWDARACRSAFVCVYDDMMLEVKGRLGSEKVEEGRSRSCRKLYAREYAMRAMYITTALCSDRRVCRSCMSLATLEQRGIHSSPKSVSG